MSQLDASSSSDAPRPADESAVDKLAESIRQLPAEDRARLLARLTPPRAAPETQRDETGELVGLLRHPNPLRIRTSAEEERIRDDIRRRAPTASEPAVAIPIEEALRKHGIPDAHGDG